MQHVVARLHGEIQGHTLNALIRAVATVSVDRALRLLSLMRTFNLKPSLATMTDLVGASARDGNAQIFKRTCPKCRSKC
eukprot:scaffold225837_cov51-Prasinocladus_malaysianus.AAC.1